MKRKSLLLTTSPREQKLLEAIFLHLPNFETEISDLETALEYSNDNLAFVFFCESGLNGVSALEAVQALKQTFPNCCVSGIYPDKKNLAIAKKNGASLILTANDILEKTSALFALEYLTFGRYLPVGKIKLLEGIELPFELYSYNPIRPVFTISCPDHTPITNLDGENTYVLSKNALALKEIVDNTIFSNGQSKENKNLTICLALKSGYINLLYQSAFSEIEGNTHGFDAKAVEAYVKQVCEYEKQYQNAQFPWEIFKQIQNSPVKSYNFYLPAFFLLFALKNRNEKYLEKYITAILLFPLGLWQMPLLQQNLAAVLDNTLSTILSYRLYLDQDTKKILGDLQLAFANKVSTNEALLVSFIIDFVGFLERSTSSNPKLGFREFLVSNEVHAKFPANFLEWVSGEVLSNNRF